MSDIIFGIHAAQAALASSAETIEQLWVQDSRQDQRIQQLLQQAQQCKVPCQQVDRNKLDKLAKGERHQGVVLVLKECRRYHENELPWLLDGLNHAPLLLVLDEVTDPHNVGACLRSADAAGVDAVIVPKNKASQLNATVRKVACGAAEHVPFIPVTNLARTLRDLQERGIWIVGTAGEAEQTLYDVSLSGGLALIMGAEGKGMRRLTREHCDQLVKLPMAGHVSSLNVSVATGICLFEIVRQRRAAV